MNTMITATLNVNKENYSGKGETVYEAVSNIPIEWQNLKTKGIIKVSKGKKSAERIFQLLLLRNIFRSKMYKQAQVKNLEWLLNNS